MRAFALVLVLLAGCVAETAEEPVCEAGKVEPCPCADGKAATQECKGDGSGWGDCACSTLTPVQSDPDISCQIPHDQSGLQPSEKCRPGERMFFSCNAEIIYSGVCANHGPFVCCKG